MHLPPAPTSCLVKPGLHLKERETDIKDLAAGLLGLLRQVLGCLFLFLPSGAKLVNLDPYFYHYTMSELHFVIAASIQFKTLVSTYFLNIFIKDERELVIFLESLWRLISIELEMFSKIDFCVFLS